MQADESCKSQRALEEMQSSLEGRDRIWQEELVKGQEELQRAKKEIEQLKVSAQVRSTHMTVVLFCVHDNTLLWQLVDAVPKLDIRVKEQAILGPHSHTYTMSFNDHFPFCCSVDIN